MSALAALAGGAALGAFGASLAQALAAWYWPLAAVEGLRALLACAAAGALAAAFAPPAAKSWLAARRARLAAAGVLSGALAAAAAGRVAAGLHPGVGFGFGSLPAWFLLLLAAPFAAGGALAVVPRGASPAGRRRLGVLLAGVAAGWLAVAALGAVRAPALAPWVGETAVEVETRGTTTAVSVGRGLREDVFAAEPGALLAFPLPEGERRQNVLVVGLANGPLVSTLVKGTGARLTVLEPHAALVREALRRWPALAEAHREGRVRFVGGSERWALARLAGRFDLIVVCESWSAGAWLSRTLGHRREHRWTVEAFEAYLERLRPRGRLLVQRPGIGRVVTTLREAAGLPAAAFAERVVVLGRGGRLVSECWYSPAGFTSARARLLLARYVGFTDTFVLYRPQDPAAWNFYGPLVAGSRVKGLYFSTPLDLSPAVDERPFFDNVERLLISRSGRALPEELESVEVPGGAASMRVVPAADRALWAILLAAGAPGLLALAAGRRRPASGGAPRAVPAGLFAGAAVALALESAAAWGQWAAPVAPVGAAAPALLLAGFAAGWLAGGRQGRAQGPGQGQGQGQVQGQGQGQGWRWPLGAAAACALACGAAYRVFPWLVRVGPAGGAALVLALPALAGAALGRAACAVAPGDGADDGALAAFAAAALHAAALASAAATLAAPHFGYRLLWALAAVAVLAAARARAAAGAAT